MKHNTTHQIVLKYLSEQADEWLQVNKFGGCGDHSLHIFLTTWVYVKRSISLGGCKGNGCVSHETTACKGRCPSTSIISLK